MREDIAVTPSTRPPSKPLSVALSTALESGDAALSALVGARPRDRVDRFRTLLTIYQLHSAPLAAVGDRARWQHHPAVAEVKTRLEADWLAELDARSLPELPAGAVGAMRALAARDRLPAAYRWLAKDADWDELVEFLALEGGPDAGFDDLVAMGQVGLTGSAKLELGTNYWDEMGNGDPAAVHTVLHDRLVAAIEMPGIPTDEQPAEALERTALGGLLSTNRWLQPELLGALGLIELQAGPRCRLVLQAFDRLAAPAAAYPFYEVHAEVDPRHGKDWLDKAVGPIVAERPDWGPRVIRGAWWRSVVNAAFFAVVPELVSRRRAAA
ncbi:MAG: iron-containing redox enzyme family protein [Mycobacteriales bacterium]